MLWHIAKPAQILSLLKNGVQTPIAQSPSAGYMFGKGMYFVDVVSKAAINSFTNRIDKQCLLMLCDVAVGEEKMFVKPKVQNTPPIPCHSVLGVGKFAPANYEVLNGSRIPYGEPIENSLSLNNMECNESSFMYNEICVYDQSQVKMAYLVLCDIEYV